MGEEESQFSKSNAELKSSRGAGSLRTIIFADLFDLSLDARFHFIFPIPIQDLTEETPFFGFTPDVMDAISSLRHILRLPQHPYEIAERREVVIAMRMAGSTFQLFPFASVGFPFIRFDERTPLICFVTNSKTHAEIVEYRSTLGFPSLQVSSVECKNSVLISQLKSEHLSACFLEALKFHKAQGNQKVVNALNQAKLGKRSWEAKQLSFPKYDHLSVLPNQLLLEAFGFEFSGESHLSGANNRPYVKAISDSADAIALERKLIGENIGLPKPLPFSLIVTAPGFYKHLYGRIRLPDDTLRPAVKLYRHILRQKDYHLIVKSEDLLELLKSEAAQIALRHYQDEIEAYSLCVAVKAVNHFVPVLRLPPVVNHFGADLENLARNARGNSPHVAFKQNKLMREFKSKLTESVSPDFISRIEQYSGGVKLISNSPLEWLQIRGLPLMLRRDVSRIPTTPGNLLFQLSTSRGECVVRTEYLQRVLIARSYTKSDPLRHLLPLALEGFSTPNLHIEVAEIESIDDMVRAFAKFNGGIAIFDGHGAPSTSSGPGTISLDGKPVDVWQHRDKLKVPPIVILSSSDTHSFDGAHASVANSFLLLGAQTVVATTLPIDARNAAVFVARLLYRLSEYLPAITHSLDRPARWISIMAGLQRMAYVTELRRFLQSQKLLVVSDQVERDLAIRMNWPVVSNKEDWFEQVLAIAAETSLRSIDELRLAIENDFNLPESLKYVQLGNPEQILVINKGLERTIFRNADDH